MNSRLQKALALTAACACAAVSEGQLRVVSYNTLDKPSTSGDLTDIGLILDAITDTDRNGIAKRPDILALQEQTTFSLTDSTASRIADELNSLFGVTSYQAEFNGLGADRLMTVYDTSTVELLGAFDVFTGGPRRTQRTHWRPVGYDSPDAEFYLYNSHLKAGSTSSDRNTRSNEATAIRANADALGPGVNVLYAGDLNLYSNSEPAYVTYRSSGNAQANDPLGLNAWPNSGVAEHLTQSTRSSNLSDGGASGGLDDRFDFQLVTSSLLDGEGLSYLGPTSTGLGGLEHSYQAFGNDGVSYNTRINNTFSGRSQSSAVINALHDFSDHLPVVADYQLPSVLDAQIVGTPETIELGALAQVEVLVRNAADVVAAVGADELDYALSAAGGLTGAFSGVLAALETGASHLLTLDTSTLGLRSGTVTVSTSSQGAANALIEIPFDYEVVAASLAGDFNADGRVDAADYTTWRDGLDAGDFVPTDYDTWVAHYGETTPGAPGATVPEPSAAAQLWSVCLAAGLPKRRFLV